MVILLKTRQMNVMSVSLLRLQNGDIALFYLQKNSTDNCILSCVFQRMRVNHGAGRTLH